MSHQHRPSVAVQERVIQEGFGSGLAMAWDVAETKREGRAKRAGRVGKADAKGVKPDVSDIAAPARSG
jgi:hypothetical protein